MTYVLAQKVHGVWVLPLQEYVDSNSLVGILHEWGER